MHYVADYHKEKCILQTRTRKAEQECQTENHARNSICYKGNAVYCLFKHRTQIASCRYKRAAVGDKCSEKGCDQSHGYGMNIDIDKIPVTEDCLKVLSGKYRLIRPVFHKRYHEYYCKEYYYPYRYSRA